MTRILWLSRHNPSSEHIKSLQTHFGSINIIRRMQKLDVDPVKGVSQIKALIKETNADEIVCVVPIQHLALLTSNNIFPIRAIMARTPTERIDGNGEKEFDFEFHYFERILNVVYEAKKL